MQFDRQPDKKMLPFAGGLVISAPLIEQERDATLVSPVPRK
jgi:hypothetical protein